jgi:serine/threonine-protein kinase ULK2
MITSW